MSQTTKHVLQKISPWAWLVTLTLLLNHWMEVKDDQKNLFSDIFLNGFKTWNVQAFNKITTQTPRA